MKNILASVSILALTALPLAAQQAGGAAGGASGGAAGGAAGAGAGAAAGAGVAAGAVGVAAASVAAASHARPSAARSVVRSRRDGATTPRQATTLERAEMLLTLSTRTTAASTTAVLAEPWASSL